jgi:phospholipase C
VTKLTLTAVVLTALFGAVVAGAQTYQAPPHFNHIVIIVQENRTPDDLFQSSIKATSCGTENHFEAGVDIQNGGPNLAAKNHGKPYQTCLTQLTNLNTGGTGHTHDPNWTTQFNSGAMDGACLLTWPNCPEYTYVTQSVVKPYFDIATNYGFANYMFQTNQGPSFPAHQFILGGTSAPVFPGDPNNYYQDFVAENASFLDSGCPVGGTGPKWINPQGNELTDPNKSECYDHNTLVTYQDSNDVVHDRGVGWKYYAQTLGIIWDAPEANPQICYGAVSGTGSCSGSEFTDHVIIEKNRNLSSAPILKDIHDCQLAAISWVTPDEAWSDHPGDDAKSLGPSYVADVVDAIGNSGANSGGKCDYWKADPTAIFITWDDWGGFYDHVPPPITYLATHTPLCTTLDAPNGWGCGYVYGFRVPLLVVSEYTPPNTVSGAISGPPTYPPPKEWTHDFGSILAFAENNFQLPPIAPSGYTYADQNSLDTNGGAYVPLWEFFLANPARGFTNIAPTASTFDANYFMNYYITPQNDGTLPTPRGPDGGDDD